MDWLGALVGGAVNWASSAWANNENQNEATRAAERAYSMRATAHQDTVRDLRAAGLNPVLSATHGATPGGAGAQAAAAQSPDAGDAMIRGFSAQMAAKKTEADIRVADAVEDRTRAEADNIRGETDPQKWSRDRIYQEISESQSRQEKILQEIEQSKGNIKLMAATEAKLRAEIPNIREQLTLIRAQTQETLQRAGHSEAAAKEILQRIKQDLPALEAELHRAELALSTERLDQARRNNTYEDSGAHFLGRVMRDLNPLQNMIISPGRIFGRSGSPVKRGETTETHTYRGRGGTVTRSRREYDYAE